MPRSWSRCVCVCVCGSERRPRRRLPWCAFVRVQVDARAKGAVVQRDTMIQELQDKLEESEVRRTFAEAALAKHRQDALAAVGNIG